jgi:DNA-directed RNA polymerase subunit M/transcription elongation factor TFIIS
MTCQHDWHFIEGTERLRCERCKQETGPKSYEEKVQEMLADALTTGTGMLRVSSEGVERIDPQEIYMKTLDNHNRDAYERMQGREPRPKAFVACPKCHSEMEFEDPHMVLASYPPKRVVICPGCGHRDYKVEA